MTSPGVGEAVIGICTLLGIRDISHKHKSIGNQESPNTLLTHLRHFRALILQTPLRAGEMQPLLLLLHLLWTSRITFLVKGM